VLTAAGLPDLIATNLDEYEALALRVAQDSEFRADIRARVAAARDGSPLFDSARFVRDLERLYERMVPQARRD
jgi:predicted O-linked N-acetylglucosamine transferase (SPINDLY family)